VQGGNALMQSDVPDSFRELFARAQAESDFETVAEIVDRIVCAASENMKPLLEHRNRKAPDM